MGRFSWLKADELTRVDNIAHDYPFKFLIPKENATTFEQYNH